MTRFARIFLLIIILLLAVAALLYVSRESVLKFFFQPTASILEEGKIGEQAEREDSEYAAGTDGESPVASAFELIAEKLSIPWEIVFLPDGDLLVTERPGKLKRIGKDSRIYSIDGVKQVGESGLLGMALHPGFAENHWLYLYLTTESGGVLLNRVERYKFINDQLTQRQIIISNIPGAAYHDGGRIAFGPDGYLYITTGDAGNAELAQDKSSLAGKILRLKDDGSIPAENPFGNQIFSYGHRNAQGLAWDNEGRLWATEHGRSGTLSGLDELNLIEQGKNYGWPLIQGDETQEGMESPIVQSGPDETWAPAGMTYWQGSLFFSGLRGESLYRAEIIGPRKVMLKHYFRKEFGRIRAVVLGPDGFLYISTSNTDGRGTVRPSDDKIIKLDPEKLQ